METTIWKTNLSATFIHNGGEGVFIDCYQNTLSNIRVFRKELVNSNVYRRDNNDYSIDLCVVTDNIKLIDGIKTRSNEVTFERVDNIPSDYVLFL